MAKHDLSELLKSKDARDRWLAQRASSRLASGDPELESCLWLLREGVIGRQHFQTMVASAIRS